ncbi:MAG TPA: GNAT family N-acetyltransferase [Allosphingosinicella sp.]|nr:GNAT family N-acetyltransferase [Allosphingosinicella sp.]
MPPPLPRAAALGVSCRPATDADLPVLAETYFSVRREEVAQTGWAAADQQRFLDHQFDAQHRHYRAHYQNAEWLVIERAGVAAGRLYLEEWPGELRLIDIALLPQARGGGIGGALLEDLMEAAAAKGKRLSIHVERNNPAMRLYVRLGFAKIDEHGIYDLMEWVPAPIS